MDVLKNEGMDNLITKNEFKKIINNFLTTKYYKNNINFKKTDLIDFFKIPLSTTLKNEYKGMSNSINLATMIYILEKHKNNVCVTYPLLWTCDNSLNNRLLTTYPLIGNEYIVAAWEEKGKKFNKKWFDFFNKCKKVSRFVIIPLNLEYEVCNKEYIESYPLEMEKMKLSYDFKTDILQSHANMMLYDKKYNSIELFEPHGSSTWYERNKIFDHLKKIFIKNGLNDINYIGDICIGVGPQNRQDDDNFYGGFCGIWSTWFADLKLTYPDINSNKLLEKTYKILDNIGYSKFIDSYSRYILQFIRNVKYNNQDLLRNVKLYFLDDYIGEQINCKLETGKFCEDYEKEKIYTVFFTKILNNILSNFNIDTKKYIKEQFPEEIIYGTKTNPDELIFSFSKPKRKSKKRKSKRKSKKRK